MRKNCLLRNVNLDFDTQVSWVCLCNKVFFRNGESREAGFAWCAYSDGEDCAANCFSDFLKHDGIILIEIYSDWGFMWINCHRWFNSLCSEFFGVKAFDVLIVGLEVDHGMGRELEDAFSEVSFRRRVSNWRVFNGFQQLLALVGFVACEEQKGNHQCEKDGNENSAELWRETTFYVKPSTQPSIPIVPHSHRFAALNVRRHPY